MKAEFRKSRMETMLATRQLQQIMMRAPTNSNKNAALASIKIAYVYSTGVVGKIQNIIHKIVVFISELDKFN